MYFKPQYSKEIHYVDKVEGGTVTDKKGKSYPTKQTYAVPKETEPSSNTGEEDAFTRRGSAQTEDKKEARPTEVCRWDQEAYKGGWGRGDSYEGGS